MSQPVMNDIIQLRRLLRREKNDAEAGKHTVRDASTALGAGLGNPGRRTGGSRQRSTWMAHTGRTAGRPALPKSATPHDSAYRELAPQSTNSRYPRHLRIRKRRANDEPITYSSPVGA